jgi:pimeloyl-ACP methyl ester carboxylesterase
MDTPETAHAAPYRLENRSALATAGSRGIALTQLTFLAAGGLTQLIASAHATIAQRPLSLGGTAAPARQAPLPYQWLTRGFLWLAALSRRLGENLPADPENGLFRSALNGVVGDTLAAHRNRLGQGMSLRDEFGAEVTPADWREQGRRGLVLFVHGLCLSEKEWQNFEHQGFVRELREFGYGVAWLRYNSGRAIHESGADLSQLLEEVGSRQPLALIGHSMGGLVIRAACQHAERHALDWQRQLRHSAYLGTPHQGAPLERLGESANRLLALTPYTQPFMRIGGLRSNGIQDLRHGRVDAGEARVTTLPEQARHLLVAGHLGSDRRFDLLGDGLVPVRSALGQHLDPARALSGRDVTRLEFAQLGHMALLRDTRVYRALLDWLLAA